MTTVVSNESALKGLFELYFDDIDALFVNPVSGAPIEAPQGATLEEVMSSLLNIYLYDPEIVLIWNNWFHPHHLAMWSPYIQLSKRRVAVHCNVLKESGPIRASLPSNPLWVTEEKMFAHHHLPVAPSLKAFFYPDNDRLNERTVHNFPNHMHVHIGHGDSDKAASANRFGAIYDHIMLADSTALQRYRNAGIEIPTNRFLPIGAPTLPGMRFSPEKRPFHNVLYAPTWEGMSSSKNFSSVEYITEQIKSYDVQRRGKIKVRPHVYLGSRDPAFRNHINKLNSLFVANDGKQDQLNRADLLICDISGIMSEFLFTGKPIVIPVAGSNDWLNAYIQSTDIPQYAYLWDFEKRSLQNYLIDIADDPLQASRLHRRDQLFAGCIDFTEIAILFDQAIDTVFLNHFWRARRVNKPLPKVRSIKDSPWIEIDKGVRNGQITLVA